MKHVRVEHEGRVVEGELRGEEVHAGGVAIPVAQVGRWLSPVVPSKIVATHLTYRSRLEEYAVASPPAAPSYFLKPTSSLSGHLEPVVRPHGCRFLNYEGEVAVVIGRRCHGVPVAEALDYVRGYTVANDWGVHDFRHADRGSMLRVKGQDGFCPLGPVLVDAADVDPDALTLRTFVNGEEVQHGDTASDLLFSFAYQIADVARLITLEPGDVLLTGTPANSRPVEPGDVVAVEVEGIGRLENTVVQSDRELEPVGDAPAVSAQTLHVALAMPEEEAERQVGGDGVLSMADQPLQIESVVDQVYVAIRERIADDTLTRGVRLHQEDLAAELGVSRTPVREALRRLAAEGLVEMRANRGARVADLDPSDIRMPYEARLVVEPGAARLAARRGKGAPQQRMRDAVAAQRREIPDVSGTFDANRDFHLALVHASGNPYLVQIVEQLWLRRIGTPIYEHQAETPERMHADADEHEQILRAIESGDARAAESLTRRHIDDAMKRSVID